MGDDGFMTNNYDLIAEPIAEAMDEKYLKIIDIPSLSIPTKTSDLTNDSGFISSHQDITGKADSSDFDTLEAEITYTNGTSETVGLYIVPVNNP